MREARNHPCVTPLDEVPPLLNAGDSYAFLVTDPDHPATDGWSFVLAFNGATPLSKSSTPDGAAHAIALSTTDTLSLASGLHRFVLRAVRPGEGYTRQSGVVEIRPDPVTASAGELASWAERALSAVEAAILGAASDEMRMMMIDGRQLQKYSMDELMRLRSRLKAEVAAEQGGFGVPIVMTATGFSS